jgi:hypothetical protein
MARTSMMAKRCDRIQHVEALKAKVQGGRLIIDEPTRLPEGAEVTLAVIDGDDLDDEERARLHAALEESADDIEAGRVISAEESLKRLRALRGAGLK